MRTSLASPDNPWPSDMVIHVENDPGLLLGLLWLRSAWGLTPSGDIPPRLESPPPRRGTSARAGEWEREWPDRWRAYLLLMAHEPDPILMSRVHSTPHGRADRARALAEFYHPRWYAGFNGLPRDNAFPEWREARRAEALREATSVPLEATPERRSLEALIAAWRVGLRSIITIPCRGTHTRVIGPSTLLATAASRRDPTTFSAALNEFRGKYEANSRW